MENNVYFHLMKTRAVGRSKEFKPPVSEERSHHVHQRVEAIYRTESRRIFATLIRLLGDFDLAEEAVHDAFRAALEQWPRDGEPENPGAWLISTGRFKGIDRIRRRAHFLPLDEASSPVSPPIDKILEGENGSIVDDLLRLIFTCCHPALSPDAQIALTLREVCGFTTEEIAHAFLVPLPTLAQRIVRAKAKIRDAGIPYLVPDLTELPDRLDAVLRVIYLVFNEGYAASSGQSLTRPDLSGEAIQLGRLLVGLLPESEPVGLLALMLLQESRRVARISPSGDLILLEDQDRSLWNRSMIEEGLALVDKALSSQQFGSYTLQAAIAAAHADVSNKAETNWTKIVGLFDLLMRIDPSPVVALNRAVAVAMRDGPEAGLMLIDTILAHGDLKDYHLAHAARADLYRRLGKSAQARSAYQRALSLTQQQAERRFLERRLDELPE